MTRKALPVLEKNESFDSIIYFRNSNRWGETLNAAIHFVSWKSANRDILL